MKFFDVHIKNVSILSNKLLCAGCVCTFTLSCSFRQSKRPERRLKSQQIMHALHRNCTDLQEGGLKLDVIPG